MKINFGQVWCPEADCSSSCACTLGSAHEQQFRFLLFKENITIHCRFVITTIDFSLKFTGLVQNREFHDFEKPSLDPRTTRKHILRPLEQHWSFASEAKHNS